MLEPMTLRNPDAFAHDAAAIQRALAGNALKLPHVALRNFLVLHCGMNRAELADLTMDGLKQLFEDARRAHTAAREAC